jgi:hypothetical protein
MIADPAEPLRENVLNRPRVRSVLRGQRAAAENAILNCHGWSLRNFEIQFRSPRRVAKIHGARKSTFAHRKKHDELNRYDRP